METQTSGAMILMLASPLRINWGVEERALVKAMMSPAPRMKSTLKGKKAVDKGTKSTPPPTPERGAITPITKVKPKRITGQSHQGMLEPLAPAAFIASLPASASEGSAAQR